MKNDTVTRFVRKYILVTCVIKNDTVMGFVRNGTVTNCMSNDTVTSFVRNTTFASFVNNDRLRHCADSSEAGLELGLSAQPVSECRLQDRHKHLCVSVRQRVPAGPGLRAVRV